MHRGHPIGDAAMKPLALLLAALALAVLLARRRVPRYPDWPAYLEDPDGVEPMFV